MKDSPLFLRTMAVVLSMLMTGLSFHGYAQCDSSDGQPSLLCEDAPVSCLQTACYTTVNESDEGHAGFCYMGTLVHNPQYFAFVAIDTVVTIAISNNSCTTGAGLQAAIIDINNDLEGCMDWENDDVIACDPNFNTIASMTAVPVVVGNTYLLLLDGSNGATCQYTITQADGIMGTELLNELEEVIESVPTACPGDETWFATVGPAIGEAHGYMWEGMPGGTVTSTSTTLDINSWI